MVRVTALQKGKGTEIETPEQNGFNNIRQNATFQNDTKQTDTQQTDTRQNATQLKRIS
jgi:hypothetical protein